MEIISKNLGDVLRNPTELNDLCDKDQVVALVEGDEVQLVIVNINVYNEMVGLANKAEMYRDLWQSEVDDRQGNMMSADEAIEELARQKKARLKLYNELAEAEFEADTGFEGHSPEDVMDDLMSHLDEDQLIRSSKVNYNRLMASVHQVEKTEDDYRQDLAVVDAKLAKPLFNKLDHKTVMQRFLRRARGEEVKALKAENERLK